jgi:hypothetical protein
MQNNFLMQNYFLTQIVKNCRMKLHRVTGGFGYEHPYPNLQP